MKVVLIDPPSSFNEMWGEWDLSSVDTYCPPLGLLYLAGFIRKHHHEPYILDLSCLKWSLRKTLEYIHSLNPDVIGISARSVNISNAHRIAEELKKQGCKAPIVLGGPHITALPLDSMKKFPSADYGVIGEGEVTFLELIENVVNGQSAAGVRGVAWRDERGKIIINPLRSLIENLDVLPLPAWDLLPNFPQGYHYNALETKRLPAALIVTSRGCPYQCTFCDRAVFGSLVRDHSAEYTLNMIRHLRQQYGIKDLMIMDDNFLLNRKRLFNICETIIDEGMGLRWYCLSHVKFMTEDRLEKIREAGCWIMQVGIESGCDRVLRVLKKNTTKAEIAAAIKRAHQAGIRIKGNFIFGLPTETRESLEETIQFALNIDISLFQQTFLTILPGCELSREADKYGKVIENGNICSLYHISFIPDGLTKQDLVAASKRAFLKFYLRPRIILETAASLTSWWAIRNFLKSFLAFMKTVFRRKG